MRIVFGAPVVGGNDRIGTVDSIAVNPETFALTHIVVKRGFLKGDVTIPFSSIVSAHSTDDGNVVQVQYENGAVIGMRDYHKGAVDSSLIDTVPGTVIPTVPGQVTGGGVSPAVPLPGTVANISVNPALGTSGITAPSEPTGGVPGVVAPEAGVTGSNYNTQVSDTDALDTFSGLGGSGSAAADVDNFASAADPSQVPSGVAYINSGCDVHDIGHDKIGTIEAITFETAGTGMPPLDALLVKGSGQFSNMVVIPKEWIGSIGDKGVMIKRPAEEIVRMQNDQFASGNNEQATRVGLDVQNQDRNQL